MYITHTDPIYFISTPNPLHFRSESMLIYFRHRIRNRSLSDLIRIREKNMVKDMVEAKSDPIRSVYTPTHVYQSQQRWRRSDVVQRAAAAALEDHGWAWRRLF